MSKFKQIKDFIKTLQNDGVPLMFIKDPRTKTPSVSLTMLMISFALVLFGILNKWTQWIQGVELDNAMELLYLTTGLYFGRAMSKQTSGTIDPEKTESK